MSKLEDFLGPLSKGVWEVSVDKTEVTEPLGADWEMSALNVPTPGTICSYRKGQYHVHETRDQWKVHLDRYDPKKHPILHLVDDAPLLLMIGDTFVTLFSTLNPKDNKDIEETLKDQKQSWHFQVIAGIFMILLGIFIFDDPIAAFSGAFNIGLPWIMVGFGILVIADGIWNLLKRKPENVETGINQVKRGEIPWGVVIVAVGIFVMDIDLMTWVRILTIILMVWMFASAIFLLIRVGRGRKAVPEGFVSRLVIGVISLAFVICTIYIPYSLVYFMMLIVSAIIFVLGLVLLVNGLRLRHFMKVIKLKATE